MEELFRHLGEITSPYQCSVLNINFKGAVVVLGNDSRPPHCICVGFAVLRSLINYLIESGMLKVNWLELDAEYFDHDNVKERCAGKWPSWQQN